MKVVFRTNIDAYNEKHPFPEHMAEVPRKGDKVLVRPAFESYYRDLKLPNRLEVVDVSWAEHTIEDIGPEGYVKKHLTIAFCELWYNQTDKQLADVAGAKTL